MALCELRRELRHHVLGHPFVRLVLEAEHRAVSRAVADRCRGTSRSRRPRRVDTSPPRPRRAKSGAPVSLKSPPETGGISATSSPSASAAAGVRVALVDRVEEAGRLVRRGRAPATHPPTRAPSESSSSRCAGTGALAQPGEESDAHMHGSQRSFGRKGCLPRPCHVTYARMPVITAARTNLNDQVYETLKSRLVRRELGPGEKVSLHELAATLGVSRSPVHHALTRLVSEGLLTVKSRRGYFVTAADGVGARGGLRRAARARAPGSRERGRASRTRRPAPLSRSARVDRGVRLARRVGHREREPSTSTRSTSPATPCSRASTGSSRST